MEKILNEILEKITSMDSKITSMDERINSMDFRINSMETNINSRFDAMDVKLTAFKNETKADFNSINKKLDTIYAQVAYNTEQEIRLDAVETDVKIIKKVVSNQ